MNRSIRSSVAVAVATLALSVGVAAQQPIVLQWQTANLTESQYEPVWKQTIAEFAENAEIIQMLRSLGVDYAQGYGVSQPQRVLKAVNS